MFVDRVKLHARGGRGGNGVTSFLRQPFEPRGRPDGGDGGHGGDVIVRASRDVATLVDLHHRPHRRGGNGGHGEGDLRRGADGADEVVIVPFGTVVSDARTGEVLADLSAVGDEVVVARAGRGGRGNAAFRTSQRRAPKFSERGEPGRERDVILELKLAADVALVGFPNAGKSSLIARLSAARPKVADYPFTTLVPNLGVVRSGDIDFVVADVPGLVEGASAGRGLGHEFLRHVERAAVLVHVLDCATYEQRDPRDDLATVVAELTAYEAALPAAARPALWIPFAERPALVVLNKIDAGADVAEIVRDDLAAQGWELLETSAATGQGLDALRHRLGELVAEARAARHEQEPQRLDRPRPVLRPAGAEQRSDFQVERVDLGGGEVGWRVHGERVERWVRMLDLDNEEAAIYLGGRLARAGVENALTAAGAKPGDDVEIAGAVFAFDPELPVDPEDDRIEAEP